MPDHAEESFVCWASLPVSLTERSSWQPWPEICGGQPSALGLSFVCAGEACASWPLLGGSAHIKK